MDGSRAQIGVDVLDTYAPVIYYSTVRLLIRLAFGNKWKCFIGTYQLLSQMLKQKKKSGHVLTWVSLYHFCQGIFISLAINIFKQPNMSYTIFKGQLNLELDTQEIWHDSREGINS